MSLKHDPQYDLAVEKSKRPRGNSDEGLLVFLLVVGLALAVLMIPGVRAGLAKALSHSDRPALNPSVVVWASKDAGLYYCQSSKLYGSGTGAYFKQGDALSAGYQPDLGNYCSASSSMAAKTPAVAIQEAERAASRSAPVASDPPAAYARSQYSGK